MDHSLKTQAESLPDYKAFAGCFPRLLNTLFALIDYMCLTTISYFDICHIFSEFGQDLC